MGELIRSHSEGNHEGQIVKQLQRCGGTISLVRIAPAHARQAAAQTYLGHSVSHS
jgi:hypothetical protein